MPKPTLLVCKNQPWTKATVLSCGSVCSCEVRYAADKTFAQRLSSMFTLPASPTVDFGKAVQKYTIYEYKNNIAQKKLQCVSCGTWNSIRISVMGVFPVEKTQPIPHFFAYINILYQVIQACFFTFLRKLWK